MPKLSPRVMSLLMNLSMIENSILFPAGRIVRVIHQNEAVAARAELDFDVPEFAVADLKEFLKALSLFTEPDLHFNKDHIVITEGAEKGKGKKAVDTNNRHRFYFSDKESFSYPLDDPKIPSIDVQFNMTTDDFDFINKASKSLALDILEIVGVKGQLTITAKSSKRGSRHTFERALGETSRSFKTVLYKSNFLVMPGSYVVEISEGGVVHFKGDKLDYWLAVEDGSSFGR